MLLKEKEKSAPTDQNGPTALNGLEPVYSHQIEAQEADEMDAAMERFLKALPVIGQWKLKKPPEKDRYGEVDCPCCKNTLHLYQSAYNGHVHAKCDTPNCIQVME